MPPCGPPVLDEASALGRPYQEVRSLTGLVHVDFNLTNSCNLACAHCHSASGSALPSELTTEEILDVIGQLHELGALTIAFAGGEPFMRSDVMAILRHACALPGWQVSVITNGLFLTEERIGALLEQCPGISVNVSVDGSNPDTFGQLRAQPNATPSARAALFRRVTKGVARASAAGLPVSVNTTITRANAYDLVPTYKFVTEELGAASQVAIKFFPAGYGRNHLDRFDFSWPSWSEFFKSLTSRKLAGEIPFMQLSVPSAWEFYLPLIHGGIGILEAERAWRYRSTLREPRYARARQVGDVAGAAELCVDGDGKVYPSILMVGAKSVVVGSVRIASMAEIWEHSELLSRLRSLRIEEISGSCGQCALSSLCGGGSRSRALADHGNWDGADLACPIVARAGTLETVN